MKRIIKISIKIIELSSILLVILFFNNCNYSYNLKGVRNCSESIEQSKERKFYISSYRLLTSDYDFFKKDSFLSNQIFIEKGFGFGNSVEETQESFYGYPKGDKQIVIPLTDSLAEYYGNNFLFKLNNTSNYCNIRDNRIFCAMKSSMIKDTITITICSAVPFDSIGSMSFIRY